MRVPGVVGAVLAGGGAVALVGLMPAVGVGVGGSGAAEAVGVVQGPGVVGDAADGDAG